MLHITNHFLVLMTSLPVFSKSPLLQYALQFPKRFQYSFEFSENSMFSIILIFKLLLQFQLWQSGFTISYSRAADALNGDKINSTIYYVLSNVPAPLHDTKTSPELALELKKTLHYPDQCYKEHTSL